MAEGEVSLEVMAQLVIICERQFPVKGGAGDSWSGRLSL